MFVEYISSFEDFFLIQDFFEFNFAFDMWKIYFSYHFKDFFHIIALNKNI